MKNEDKSVLKLIFAEVIQGFSLIEVPSLGEIKVKHLTSLDAAKIDILKDKYFNKAKDKGLPTEEEKLAELEQDGSWTQEDEQKVKELKDYLSNLRQTRKSLFIKRDIKPIDDKIEQAENKIYRNVSRKVNLLGLTCDLYSTKRISEYYVLLSLRDLNDEMIFPLDSIEDFSSDLDTELFEIIKNRYNHKIDKINSKNLKRISVSPFFLNFYVLCEKNPSNFFGKSIVELTFHQAELSNHARHMMSIIENAKNTAPDYLYDDPDELIAFYEGQVNSDKLEENNSGKDGSTIVGATKEDMKNLGMDKDDPNTKDLAKEAVKKGGSLSMQDLMELHGIK